MTISFGETRYKDSELAETELEEIARNYAIYAVFEIEIPYSLIADCKDAMSYLVDAILDDAGYPVILMKEEKKCIS